MYANGYGAYRQTGVITADPKKLVIMCYEEAIRNLHLAKAKYLSKEFEGKAKAVSKTLDIINELRGSLDLEKGGQIAKNLDALYGFMTRHILRADGERNTKGFSDVASMLEELRSALEKAFNSLPNEEMAHLSRYGDEYTTQSIEFLR